MKANFKKELWSSKYMDEFTYSDLSEEMDSELITFANIQLWNGKTIGYKELNNNINSILTITNNEFELVEEDGNVKLEYAHHDGFNTAVIRRWRKNISESSRKKVLESIYENKDNAYELFLKFTVSILSDLKKLI